MTRKPESERQWYVARIRPGAARPDARDHRITKVERDLIENGFDCYMPVEVFDAVHRRKRKLIQKTRQMVPGYIFVTDVTNFWALSECRTIAGIIGINGCPAAISDRDMAVVRAAETEIFEALALKRRKAAESRKKMTRGRLLKSYPRDTRVRVNAGFLQGQEGTVQEATGRKSLRIVLDQLQNLGTIELDIDEIDLVA